MKPLTPRPGDEPVTIDLDTAWLGVNERDDPAALATEEGSFVTAAENVRFRTRRAETRGGWVLPVQLQVFSHTGGFFLGSTSGAALYVDADGAEWVAVAGTAELEEGETDMYLGVFFGRMAVKAREVSTATGVVPPVRSSLLQAGAEMIWWRDNGEPLHWSGDWTDAWEESTHADVTGYASYLRPLPPALFGCYAGDRVVFPYGAGIGYTDILAPRRWDDALDQIPVGGAGAVTGLALWRERALIVFKETSVWALDGWTGDLSGTVLTLLTDQAGCIAHRTVTAVGGDIIFLGRGGVYRLTEVLEGSRQLSPVPVSWAIPRSMERINWVAAAGQACATLADGLWYLAVPVDGSLTNNAIFVYDTVTGYWQGEDVLTAHGSPRIYDMVSAPVFGVESPILCGEYSFYAGGHGWHDGFGTGDIATDITFRGYALGDAGLKTLQRLEVQTEEMGTVPALYARSDGIRTEQTVQTAPARDRTQWLHFGAGTRTMSNSANDAGAPNREDYAWVVSDAAACKASGIPLGNLQRHKLAGMVRGVQCWVQPRVTSTRGRLRLCAVRGSGIKARDHARRQ